jgi:hypothetical protein
LGRAARSGLFCLSGRGGRNNPGHGALGVAGHLAACFELAMTKDGKAQKSAARSARLSAALRENLKRRKEQARSRQRAIEAETGQDISNETGANSPSPEAATAAPPEFRRNQVRE